MKILVAAVACVLLGCELPCGPVPCPSCSPAIVVEITDASSGGAVTDVTLAGFSCSQQTNATVCVSTREGAGTFELVAQAPGYLEARQTVTVPAKEHTPWACCACPYVGQNVSMTMQSQCAGVACGACAPAIQVTVTASTGGPVADATITDGICHAGTDSTLCTIEVASPGPLAATIAAPGFQAVSLTFTVEDDRVPGACCTCGYVPQTRDITLSPL